MTNPLDIIERVLMQNVWTAYAYERCAHDPEALGLLYAAYAIRNARAHFGCMSPDVQDALDRETAILAERLHELRERRRMRESLLQNDPSELTAHDSIGAMVNGWVIRTSGPGRADLRSTLDHYPSWDAIDVDLPQGGTCVSFDGVPVLARAYGTTDLDDYRAGHRQVVETVLLCIEAGRDDVAGVVSALGALDVKESV
jgi:hypothetical protein